MDDDTLAFVAETQVLARRLDLHQGGSPAEQRHWEAPRQYRIAVVGDQEVGKTCLVKAIVAGQLIAGDDDDDYEPTLTEEPVETVLTVGTKSRGAILLRLVDWAWDQAYQIRHKDILTYLKDMDGGIFVFSYTDPATLKNLTFRFAEFERARAGGVSLLVGHKRDVPKLRVADRDVWAIVSKKKSCNFVSTSARTGEGLKEAMLTLTRLLEGDDDLEVEWTEPGVAPRWSCQAARAERAQELSDSAQSVEELAQLVASHLGMDELASPLVIAKSASKSLLGCSIETEDDNALLRTMLIRCAVVLEEQAQPPPADILDAVGDAADKNEGRPEDTKSKVARDRTAAQRELDLEVLARAQEENVRRAERVKAKALEQRKRDAEEQRRKAAEEEANLEARRIAKAEAKAKAEARTRLRAEQARLKQLAARGPLVAANRALEAAFDAADAAFQAMTFGVDWTDRARRRHFEHCLNAVSAAWPCVLIHVYDKKYRGFSLRLTLPESWRTKTVHDLLALAVDRANRHRRASGVKKVPKSALLRISSARLESIFGVSVDPSSSVFHVVSVAKGCLFLRRVATKRKA